MDYLEEEDKPPAVDDIKGILVASDNATIVDEVRDLAHLYFPGVRNETVVFIGEGVPGGVKNTGMTTQTRTQVLMTGKTKSSSTEAKEDKKKQKKKKKKKRLVPRYEYRGCTVLPSEANSGTPHARGLERF